MKSTMWFLASMVIVFSLCCGVRTFASSQKLISGFNAPTGIAYAKDGTLYISGWGDGRISNVKDGNVSICLDNLSSPAGLVFDDAGNLYIAGYGDGNIYIWDGKNKPRILASGFSSPTGLLWTKDNNLLVANRNAGEIVAVNASGGKKVISSGHKTPVGVAQTEDGHIFVSCYGGSVDVIAPDGKKSSISNGLGTPGVGIVPASSDSVYVVDYGRGNIAEVGARGFKRTVANGLSSPVALARTPDGNIIVGCWGDGSLHFINQ